MPGDNAAPPTQPRTESIVCTSLVLLSSPALSRRGAQGTGSEEAGGVADNGVDGGSAMWRLRDRTTLLKPRKDCGRPARRNWLLQKNLLYLEFFSLVDFNGAKFSGR